MNQSAAPEPPQPRANRSGLVLGGTLALTLALALVTVRVNHFYPITQFDTEQRAASARELLETGRWSAATLRNWELIGHAHTAEGRPWPVQVWSLGYPLVLAAGFALFGVKDAVALAVPLLAYLGCVALAFFLARGLWGARVAALTCLLLLVENDLIWWSAYSHLEPVQACAILGAVLLVVGQPQGVGRIALAGVLLGMAYFLRPTAVFWFPLLLLAGGGLRGRVRWGRIAAATAGLVAMLAVSVLLTRWLSAPPLPVTGPTISYAEAQLREGTPHEVLSGRNPQPQPLARSDLLSPGLLLPKFRSGLVMGLKDVRRTFPLPFFLLGPIGLVLGWRDRRARGLAVVGLLAMLGAWVTTALTAYWGLDRYFSGFVPLVAPFAALGLLGSWGWAKGHGAAVRGAYLAALALLLVFPFGWRYRFAWGGRQALPEVVYLSREVAAATPPEALIGSWRAADLAWHGHRRGIRTAKLPGWTKPADYLTIDRDLCRLDALVIEEEAFEGRVPPERLGPFVKLKAVPVPSYRERGRTHYRTYTLYRKGAVSGGAGAAGGGDDGRDASTAGAGGARSRDAAPRGAAGGRLDPARGAGRPEPPPPGSPGPAAE